MEKKLHVTGVDNKNVYIFIDASNLWQAQKSKGKMFDYEFCFYPNFAFFSDFYFF